MKLYFGPGACSLASRIALYEAGLAAEFERVDFFAKTTESGGNYWDVTAKGSVPALELDDGRKLTDGLAILQYIADQAPQSGLAPASDDFARYELQCWLAYVATDLHKQVVWFQFAPPVPPEARTFAMKILPLKLAMPEAHLTDRTWLMGEQFTVADAYLGWVLGTLQGDRTGYSLEKFPALAAYYKRFSERPSVARAYEDEKALMAA